MAKVTARPVPEAPSPGPPGGRGPHWRGTVEGFYGRPWSHAARLAHLEFSSQAGLDTYVYAPKNDPYHRERWREPYPPGELARLAELAALARRLGMRFVHTLAPALSMRFAEDAEHAALAAKAGQLFDAGITSFGLLFDDVPPELTWPADVARFGAGAGGPGAAHGETCRRFAEEFLAPRRVTDPLFVCPTDYAGTGASAYRDELARTAPDDVLIAWTGADIVVGSVTADDIDRAAASYRRRLVLWDNFPVNDFDPARLFLGPLTGRAARGAEAALHGVLANPMPEAAASRLAVATVADWARDPEGYDPQVSAREALTRVAGRNAAALAPLVRVCGAWPPSADQDPELTAATRDALGGSASALATVARRLEQLAAGCRAVDGADPLVAELRPWLEGAAATAEAGLAAARLLRAARAQAPAAEMARLRQEARRALDAAEDGYPNVLRPIVPPFVRDVLEATAPPDDVGRGRPVALLVAGPLPAPGDRAAAELLESRGFTVLRTGRPAEEAALVVVAPGAGPEAVAAVARVAVPLVAWHACTDLGIARGRGSVMSGGRVQITAAGDPLAAGYTGEVPILRGPGRLTVHDVEGTAARVVARESDRGGAVIVRYAAGDPLAEGTPAPAARVGLFLGPDGPARWLLSEEGHALVAAAVDTAVRTPV
jgi:beta-N-acetylglucosaminidase